MRGDDIDQTRAKRNVEDALAANPDIDCMVGFYSYNTPAHLRGAEGRRQARHRSRSSASTRIRSRWAASRKARIVGTVVQQPYEWGYQGMKLMAKYLEGDKSGIPANKLIIVPTKIIDKANVDAFWAELKQRTGAK